MNRNQTIVKMYPWLAIIDENDEPILEATLLDLLPEGWRSLVLDMSYYIAEALDKHNIPKDKYKVSDAKEKWRALSWFSYIDDWNEPDDVFIAIPDEILAIEREYEAKSQNVCMMCGKYKKATDIVCKECKSKL